MATITIELPDDAFAALQRSPEEVAREMREAAAARWYDEGRVSQGFSAVLAGLNRVEFLDCLFRFKVEACQITSEELRQEVEYDLQSRRERIAPHLLESRESA